MLNPQTLQLFSTVSFEMHAAGLLPASVKNAKLMAIMDADTARQSGLDAAAMHANVYPFLPNTVPNNYRQLHYAKFRLASGQDVIYALAWIKDETWVVKTTQSLRFIVEDLSPADQNRILEALSANGFNAVNVEVL